MDPRNWRWQGWPTPDEARATESVVQLLRVVGLGWILLQVVVNFVSDTPAERVIGAVALAVLALGVVVLARARLRTETAQQARLLTVGGLAFDAVIVLGAVTSAAAVGEPPPWETLLFLVAEGGIRLQLPGAAVGWVLALVGLVGVPVLAGAEPPPVDLLVYRGGLAGLMGLLFGLLSAAHRAARADAVSRLEQLRGIDQWRSRLLGVLAHDLRSPQATTLSVAQTLHDRGQELDASTKHQLTGQLIGQGLRAQRLVDDLLTMAQSEQREMTIKREEVEVARLVSAAVEATGVDAAIDVDAGLQAYIDPARVEQALCNLLTNAQHHGAPPIIIVARNASDAGIDINVTDHGPGVPVEDRPQLFSAFEHGQRSGSIGLGLWIVQEIVRSHGGDVSYRDNQPHGARFTIHLPPPTDPPT